MSAPDRPDIEAMREAERGFQTAATDLTVLPRLADEYLALRDEIGPMDARRKRLRDMILPLLEGAGGSFTDEARGVRLVLKRAPRGFSYDPSALYKLVQDGKLHQREFDNLLVTSIDAKKLEVLLKKGLITDRDIQRAGAKVPSRIEERLEVEPLKGGRR